MFMLFSACVFLTARPPPNPPLFFLDVAESKIFLYYFIQSPLPSLLWQVMWESACCAFLFTPSFPP